MTRLLLLTILSVALIGIAPSSEAYDTAIGIARAPKAIPDGDPAEDRLYPHTMTIRRRETTKVILTATLVLGESTDVTSEDALTVRFDDVPVLEVPAGALTDKGKSGRKLVWQSEDGRVRLKFKSRKPRIRLKMKRRHLVDDLTDYPTITVELGTYSASWEFPGP